MAPTGTAQQDVERYKQAVNDVLQQLDFCIGYLAGVNKGKVADSLARNRNYIREQLLGQDAEPLPTGED